MAGEVRPLLHIIAGPNGVGKSTFSARYVPTLDHPVDLVNPDDLGQGAPDQNHPKGPVSIARDVVTKINRLFADRNSFVLETTLSGMMQLRLAQRAIEQGWEVKVVFICVDSIELSTKRIQSRVDAGGHDVPESAVRRRFSRSICNLYKLVGVAHAIAIYDNSQTDFNLVATHDGAKWDVEDDKVFARLTEFKRDD